MDCVRCHISVRDIVHEEVVDAVIFCAVDTNRMDELMDSETAHEAEFRVVVAVVMDDVGLI